MTKPVTIRALPGAVDAAFARWAQTQGARFVADQVATAALFVREPVDQALADLRALPSGGDHVLLDARLDSEEGRATLARQKVFLASCKPKACRFIGLYHLPKSSRDLAAMVFGWPPALPANEAPPEADFTYGLIARLTGLLSQELAFYDRLLIQHHRLLTRRLGTAAGLFLAPELAR